MESADERKKALEIWLFAQGVEAKHLQPMQNDASFRRYFRATTTQGTLVVMDAPPPQENCQAYMMMADRLRRRGLSTPEIIAADPEQGFLLITDFGDVTYLKAMNAENVNVLYSRALEALSLLQGCEEVDAIPYFSSQWMHQEWAWHKEWFLNKLLGLQLTSTEEKKLNACYERIVNLAIAQPQVLMHRDYHSGNLMVLPEGIGILDFQDAFMGPVTYDLASLLRDCYVAWPEEQVRAWVYIYWQQLTRLGVLKHVDQQQFLHWFDWMSIQRHLKALFTFARKEVRDHQPHYLKHIPRTLNYVLQTTACYPELSTLQQYMQQIVKPAMKRVLL